MSNQLSKGDRIAAPILGALQFGLISVLISYYITGITPEVPILLRACPGLVIGAIIGLKFPKVALLFGMFSIG